MTIDKKKRFLIDSAFIALVAVLLYFLFKFATIYLLPFLIGLILAVLVQKPAKFLADKVKIKKGISSVILVIVLYLLVITIFSALCFGIYKKIFDLVSLLSNNISSWVSVFDDISGRFSNILNELPAEISNAVKTLPETLLSKLTEFATTFLSGTATLIAKNIPNLIITIIVTIVASCYLAKDYDRITVFLRSHLTGRINAILCDTKEIFFTSILKLLKSYFLLMFITFAELSIGLLIIGVKNPILLAGVIAFVDLLPVLGTGAVVIPWAVVALISGNLWLGIGLAVLYLIITIVRNFLEPKIIGDLVGLHPLVTLVCMFVGLRLFGILGMFGVPIAVIILAGLQRRGTINIFSK